MLILYMGHGVTSQIVSEEQCLKAASFESKSAIIECIKLENEWEINCD